MTAPSSPDAETIGGLRGLGSLRTGSVNTVMAALRQTLQGIDHDLGDIQAQMQSHMSAAEQARNGLSFLRRVESMIVAPETRLTNSVCNADTVLNALRENNIQPGSPYANELLRQIGRRPGGAFANNPDNTVSTGVAREQITQAVNQAQGRLDSISNLLQNDGRALQALMNHRGESMNTISQLLNSEHESNMAAIRNIK